VSSVHNFSGVEGAFPGTSSFFTADITMCAVLGWLLSLVAAGMSEGERVAETYTESELEELWQQAGEETDDRLSGFVGEEENSD
jgi:hypothetical protein